MGLVSLPTCHSIMGKKRKEKKEHLLKVSRSPLTVLKLHFISFEEQLTLRLKSRECVRKTHQQREESICLPGCENEIT